MQGHLGDESAKVPKADDHCGCGLFLVFLQSSEQGCDNRDKDNVEACSERRQHR